MARLNQGEIAYYWNYETGELIITQVKEVIIPNILYLLEDKTLGRVDANDVFSNIQELLHNVTFCLSNRISSRQIDIMWMKKDKNKAIEMLKQEESSLHKFHVTFDYKPKDKKNKNVYHADYIEEANSIREITSRIGKRMLHTDFEVDWLTYKITEVEA